MRTSMKTATDKLAIAAALQEIGTLLELKGGEYFKARAYKLGARAVAEVNEDLGKLIKENRLTFVKVIGSALAKQIQDLYTTGQSTLLKELRAEMPAGIIELGKVLSVKKVQTLREVLGISSVEELKAAAEAGKVRHVPGFGAKTEQGILAAIEAISENEHRELRIHIHHALRAGEQILEYLRNAPGFIQGQLAGSLRRRQETVSQIVVVASAKKTKKIIEHFARFPLAARIEEQTPQRASLVLSEGFKATLFAVKPDEFALRLLFATGSEAHLRKLEQGAAKKKLKLNERGLEKVVSRKPRSKSKIATRAISAKTEPEIYRRPGMQYVPPELREDQGEVEAARRHALPEDLITTA